MTQRPAYRRAAKGRVATLAWSMALLASAQGSVATMAAVTLSAIPRTAHAQKGGQSTQKLIDEARARFEDQQYDESIQKLSAALLRQAGK